MSKKIFLVIAFIANALFSFSQNIYDAYNFKEYKLKNGLTFYASVNKTEPRVQTYIATKAGSKNDPADATGLAHYLEHMVFKGTDKYGTLDYQKEKIQLDKIEQLYEQYRQTKDKDKRKTIYRQIDSISGEAAKLAIANEYDKMLAAIGAKGSNAFTSFEVTAYTADIPSTQINTWLDIEYERFRNPVLRIFHTELEAVYEEKNISLDSDFTKIWEELFATLFPSHTYGTQTTIGTIEHLKNPSIKKIKEYYSQYYVPNNMAIIMSGDFNPDEVYKKINDTFGKLPVKQIPEFKYSEQPAITQPIEKTIIGPDAAQVFIGYRLKGYKTTDTDYLNLLNKVLSNGTAGLIDINLNQQQKLLNGFAGAELMNDYSVLIIGGSPKEGQSLDEVKNLLLQQIEKIKKGEFNDWLIEACINNIKLQEIKKLEKNELRANEMLNAFIHNTDWTSYSQQISRLQKITKKDLVAFANASFSNNYVVIKKETGESKNNIKVEKPLITPVEVNRDAKSPFVAEILSRKVNDVQPEYLDFNKELQQSTINKIPFIYKANDINDLFKLTYTSETGSNNNRLIPVAIEYWQLLGTETLSNEKLKQELFRLGSEITVTGNTERTVFTLTGLSENFEKSAELFEENIFKCKADEIVLKSLVSDIIKRRSDDKIDKEVILREALYNYGLYNGVNPFTNNLSNSELEKLKAEDLTRTIKNLFFYKHKIAYFGKNPQQETQNILTKNHQVPEQTKLVAPEQKFEFRNFDNNEIFIVNYPDMQQAEVTMISKEADFNKNILPSSVFFNEYFGGGMSSIVFQTLRESKALAYGTSASYSPMSRKEQPYIINSYIGTQSDKLNDALSGMFELLNNMPYSPLNFDAAKMSLLQKLRTEKITGSNIIAEYEKLNRYGLTEDLRKMMFTEINTFDKEKLTTFYTQHVKDKKYKILILADIKRLDLKELEKFGKVQELKIDQIFNY